jgi:hypothetical protein
MPPQPPAVSLSIHVDIPITGLDNMSLDELLKLARRLREIHDEAAAQLVAPPSKEQRRSKEPGFLSAEPTDAELPPPTEEEIVDSEPEREVRVCGYSGCRKPLVRKEYPNGKLEAPSSFNNRSYCDRSCARRANVEKGVRFAPKQDPEMDDGRRCDACDKRLVRKRRGDGSLEALQDFKRRRTCGARCAGKLQQGKPKPTSGPKRKASKKLATTDPGQELPAHTRYVTTDDNGAVVPADPVVIVESPAPLPERTPAATSEPGETFDPRPPAMRPGYDSGAGGMKTVERIQTGTCECGEQLNAFGVCPACARREGWRKGQRMIRPRVDGGS